MAEQEKIESSNAGEDELMNQIDDKAIEENDSANSSAEVKDEKRPYGRETLLLRDVDAQVTEEEVVALFDGTQFNVVSAKPDVGNVWYVQLENEDQAKNAVLHYLSNPMELHGSPVHMRVKGTTPSSSAVTTPRGQGAQAGQAYMQGQQGGGYGRMPPAYRNQHPPGVIYTGGAPGAGWKPPTSNSPRAMPGQGSYKKSFPSNMQGIGAAPVLGQGVPSPSGSPEDENAEGMVMDMSGEMMQMHQHHGHQGGRGMGGHRGGKGGGGRGGQKGRKERGHQVPAQVKQPSFQPGDFPTLGGKGAEEAAAPAAAQSNVAAAPAASPTSPSNAAPSPGIGSWAAIAKTAPAPVEKKKEPVAAAPAPSTAAAAAPAEAKKTEKRSEGRGKSSKESSRAAAASPAKEDKQGGSNSQFKGEQPRRGWEQPEITKKATSPSPPSNGQSSSPDTAAKEQGEVSAKAQDAPAAASSAETMNGHSEDKSEKAAANADKSSNAGPWAKSFAQVIKEPPSSKPAPAASQSSGAFKASESWGDFDDDDDVAARPSGGAARPTSGAPRQNLMGSSTADKLVLSSDNSDWRKDASRRREQQNATSGARRGYNGAN